MITGMIRNFKTPEELQKSLEGYIAVLKIESEKLSKQIGEKMRATDSSNAAELQELKQKLEGGPADPKKKSQPKKKDQKTNWYAFDAVSIYDGIGLKGELELYFKAMEKTKAELEMITKVKQSVDSLISKGLKRDMGCVLHINESLPAEIAFTTPSVSKKKFSLKMVFDVPVEG